MAGFIIFRSPPPRVPVYRNGTRSKASPVQVEVIGHDAHSELGTSMRVIMEVWQLATSMRTYKKGAALRFVQRHLPESRRPESRSIQSE